MQFRNIVLPCAALVSAYAGLLAIGAQPLQAYALDTVSSESDIVAIVKNSFDGIEGYTHAEAMARKGSSQFYVIKGRFSDTKDGDKELSGVALLRYDKGKTQPVVIQVWDPEVSGKARNNSPLSSVMSHALSSTTIAASAVEDFHHPNDMCLVSQKDSKGRETDVLYVATNTKKLMKLQVQGDKLAREPEAISMPFKVSGIATAKVGSDRVFLIKSGAKKIQYKYQTRTKSNGQKVKVKTKEVDYCYTKCFLTKADTPGKDKDKYTTVRLQVPQKSWLVPQSQDPGEDKTSNMVNWIGGGVMASSTGIYLPFCNSSKTAFKDKGAKNERNRQQSIAVHYKWNISKCLKEKTTVLAPSSYHRDKISMPSSLRKSLEANGENKTIFEIEGGDIAGDTVYFLTNEYKTGSGGDCIRKWELGN